MRQKLRQSLSLVRDDPDDATVAVLEHQFPGLGGRLASAAQRGADGPSDGVQSPRPVATRSAAVGNWSGGVQQLHPEPGTRCNRPPAACNLRSHAVAFDARPPSSR